MLDEINTNIETQSHYVVLPLGLGVKILNGMSSMLESLVVPS